MDPRHRGAAWHPAARAGRHHRRDDTGNAWRGVRPQRGRRRIRTTSSRTSTRIRPPDRGCASRSTRHVTNCPAISTVSRGPYRSAGQPGGCTAYNQTAELRAAERRRQRQRRHPRTRRLESDGDPARPTLPASSADGAGFRPVPAAALRASGRDLSADHRDRPDGYTLDGELRNPHRQSRDDPRRPIRRSPCRRSRSGDALHKPRRPDPVDVGQARRQPRRRHPGSGGLDLGRQTVRAASAASPAPRRSLGVEVPSGRYRLSESGPPDYTASGWNCQNGTDAPFTVRDEVDVPPGPNMRCVITNTLRPPAAGGPADAREPGRQHRRRDRQGDRLDAARRRPGGPVRADRQRRRDPRRGAAWAYRLAESGGPSDYSASDWSCQNRTDTPLTTPVRIDLAAGSEVTLRYHQQLRGGARSRRSHPTRRCLPCRRCRRRVAPASGRWWWGCCWSWPRA